MKTEKIKAVNIKDIMDRIGVDYFSKWAWEFWIRESWKKTDWWGFNVNKNIVKDFSKWRPDWDWFWFVKEWFEFDDAQTFWRFKDNFWITDDEIKETKKPIRAIRQNLETLNDKQIEYLKSRWIEYEPIKDIVRDYNWWIWCLVYETNSPKWLNARTLSNEHNKRFMALKWYSTKWIYQHELDFTKEYLVVVEWLIDFLTLRQFDSNVVWLKSAESWIDELEKLQDIFKIIYIPDNDEAGKQSLDKFKSLKYSVMDLSKYWTYKDINDMFMDMWQINLIPAILEEWVEALPINSTFDKFELMQSIIKERWKLGFDWPFKEIYNKTSWVIPWKVYTIWAYSNVWKSKFAYYHVKYFLEQWHKVLFINNEVDEANCLMNLIQSMDNKTSYEIMEHKTDKRKYKNLIIRDDLYLLDDVVKCIENTKPDMVFIDFVQNIESKGWSDYEKNANIAKTIQRTAIKNKCVIYSLSQMSNSVWKDVWNGNWDFISLKWSWEYFASSDVIFVLRKWEPWQMELKISKNKFWPNWSEHVLNVDYARNRFSYLRWCDVF